MRYLWTRRAGRFVIDCESREVATVDRSLWSERATGRIEGRPWELGKDGSARTAVALEGGERLKARKVSIWTSEWRVEADNAVYTLVRPGLFTTRLEVSRDGAVLGTVVSGSLWSNRPVLEVDPSVPLSHAVFLLWIAVLVRARAASAGS